MLDLEKSFGLAIVSKRVASHLRVQPNLLLARQATALPITSQYFRTNFDTMRSSEIISPALESAVMVLARYFTWLRPAALRGRRSIPTIPLTKSRSDGGKALQRSL